MKKKLGVLVLTLASLVISAACASSGASSKPEPAQADSGETWAKAGPSELASRACERPCGPDGKTRLTVTGVDLDEQTRSAAAPPRRPAASREER